MAFLSADRLRAMLADARRKPDVALLSYGLRQSWISIQTVEELLLAGDVRDSTDEVAVAVSVAMDEGEDAVQAVLDAATAGRDNRDGVIRKVWWGLFIADVLSSQENTNALLTRIATLWSDVEYPTEWESFINYLPPQPDSAPGSPEAVLERAAQGSKTWVAMLEDGRLP